MCRQERCVTAPEEITTILRQGEVCYLAMCNDDQPYVVPLNYGYYRGNLYFHCASVGKKLTMLTNNQRVSFVVVPEYRLAIDQGTSYYRSVIGFGRATGVDDPDEKRLGLQAIMDHYAAGPLTCPEAVINRTRVIKVEIETLTAKQNLEKNGE